MSKLKKPQKSLKAWTKQKWTTKSGKKSSETGERYLPKKQPAKVAKKVRKYRKVK